MVGIYKILNKTTNRFYIGSSKNIDQRWSKHKALLRHDNKKLQNFWNKYLEADFEFSVLEECLEEELLVREQYYLDTYDSIWTYEPINFIWARRSQTRYTLVVVDVIENTYSFYDSIPEFLIAVGYTINSRQTLTKCINENKLFKNQYRCFKLEAPVIYDSKPFELLGHREDLITKTNEEILNVNV